ncbi:MAG: flavodoxin [Lachnospiraceae bacterium]
MKKLITLLLSLMLVLNIAACGSQNNQNGEQTSQPAEESTAPESTSETESQFSGESTGIPTEETNAESAVQERKALVVYYSATGNTKEAAEYIAVAAGADLFELIPEEPYTSDDLNWRNQDSRVSREHDNPNERVVPLVKSTVSDWEAYDTVFIGYPIWWGIAAWPVDGFIAANDFTGKTVIPFCTSTSSGLGESGELLAEAAGTGSWLKGYRFRSGVSEEDVKSWVENLGL